MTETTLDTDELGPELSLEDVDLPEDIAAGLGVLYGSAPPETSVEWMATVRSVSESMTGAPPTVEIAITDDGVDYSHSEAVVSLGISDHVEASDDPTLEAVYTQVCLVSARESRRSRRA